MTAGIISLSARWSPNSCSLLSLLSRARTFPLAISHAVASRNMTGTMFHKANEAYKSAASSQQHPPAKQFLPSSSPSSHTSDIRDLIRERRLNSSMANPASDTATVVSAKNTQGRTKSLDDETPSAANRGHPSKISTLYSANSDSFKSEPSSIDLTGIDETHSNETHSKTFEPVYFAEEDFSDDSDLDLDFKAPLPVPVPLAKEKNPPSSMSIQSQAETLIPWSSSPVSHKQPPRNQPTVGAAYAMSRASKRAASVEIIDDPTPKKVKRVLPAGFKKEESLEAEGSMRKGFAQDGSSTTTQKRKAPWDASASAIQEQRKALKTQHNSRTMDSTNNDPSMGSVTEKPFDIGEQIAKAAPITLSSEQEHVLDMVVNQGQSVFFTGPAGTGKSVLMRAIIQELKRKHRGEPDRVAVTASTGLAACNIGGVTLHSFSGNHQPLCSSPLSHKEGKNKKRINLPSLLKSSR
ncbi:hypothetical protein E4U40_002251 [Claviceps sp. LM458 group G5]|nr:hypothetical protein E4U40_002251 [Claviceps sp. LM458 group G5]